MEKREWWKNALYVFIGIVMLSLIYGIASNVKAFFVQRKWLYILIGSSVLGAGIAIIYFIDDLRMRKTKRGL